jgi:hypothetical protein
MDAILRVFPGDRDAALGVEIRDRSLPVQIELRIDQCKSSIDHLDPSTPSMRRHRPSGLPSRNASGSKAAGMS